jgi:hypothetical protein
MHAIIMIKNWKLKEEQDEEKKRLPRIRKYERGLNLRKLNWGEWGDEWENLNPVKPEKVQKETTLVKVGSVVGPAQMVAYWPLIWDSGNVWNEVETLDEERISREAFVWGVM